MYPKWDNRCTLDLTFMMKCGFFSIAGSLVLDPIVHVGLQSKDSIYRVRDPG